jgi:KaiC/GvpD/RAD55 family RecA-like ATPase
VAARTEQLRESMEEELAQFAFDESVATKEGLVEKVDGYLDFVVEQWLKNNAVALDRGIKAEIFESFVGKMKNVFVEHNINLPDEEFDLVESSIHKAEELEVQLDEQVAQNVELLKTIKAQKA